GPLHLVVQPQRCNQLPRLMPSIVQGVVLDALKGQFFSGGVEGQQGAQVAVVPVGPWLVAADGGVGVAKDGVVERSTVAPDQGGLVWLVDIAHEQRQVEQSCGQDVAVDAGDLVTGLIRLAQPPLNGAGIHGQPVFQGGCEADAGVELVGDRAVL